VSDVGRTCELERSVGGADRGGEGRRPETEGGPNPLGHCITCSDEGIPMRIVGLDEERCLALCEREDGARSTVEILLVAPVVLGDTVLVHAGTALRKMEEVAG